MCRGECQEQTLLKLCKIDALGLVMKNNQRDRELGMDGVISRRDFLDGVAVTMGSAAVAMHLPIPGAQEMKSPSYPPALTGLRGDQDHTDAAIDEAYRAVSELPSRCNLQEREPRSGPRKEFLADDRGNAAH